MLRCLIFLFASFATPAWGAHPCALGEAFEGAIASTLSGRGVRLSDEDPKYVLAHLNQVRFSTDGNRISLFKAATKPDRYGRIAVHAFDKNGWVQGRLLETGLAYLSGDLSVSPCLSALQASERVASNKKIGLWREKARFFDADELEDLAENLGRHLFVTGTVLSVGNREKRLYLNFGSNWRQDFTVVVVKKGADAFNGNIEALKELEGKRVRVRGAIEENQGPLVRLFYETQLEILD